MKPLLKFLVGLIAVFFIGIFSIERNYLPGSMASVDSRLEARARAALADVGAGWADVDIDGQKAVLYGAAPSREALGRAKAALAGAPWRAGPLFGAVTAIDASFATVDAGPPLIEPFIWLAERQGEELIFAGYAPSEAARDAIAQLAAMRFAGFAITDETEIARGAPPEEPWLAAASISLQALARLEPGGVEASDTAFTVTGVPASPEDADAIRILMDATPAGVEGRAVISLSDPQPPPPELVAIDADDARRPEAPTGAPVASPAADGGADVSAGPAAVKDEGAAPAMEPAPITAPAENAPTEAPTPTPTPRMDPQHFADCLNRLSNATAGFRLSFSSNGVQFTAASDDRLMQIATLLFVCPSFKIEIIGHTDVSGPEASNRRLSRQRATAAAAALAGYGISLDRVIVRGAGSSEPIADNASAQGRARNRRIEFKPAPPAQ